MASDGVPATATKSAAPDPLIGRVIADRFRITSLIARGGMGKVYKAEQAPLGRVCAVKVLNPNYNGDADPEFHRRFFREASITSRITHPNSVTIFDYGKTDDDVYYMAMEFLDGQTLHQALRDVGTMREDRVGRIAQQLCRALREAHTLDVIHRDLKPANIFLMRHGDEDDFVKVLDFGLVKHLSERPEEQLTQTGLFMGSPKYMAPEQIQGGHVDARTDVYSLGIMMYEMLAGKVPFERPTSVNILMAHVGEPPPPMRAVNPNLVCSPAFEELVMRCIAKDPNGRYVSMDAVLQAIKQAHGGSMTGQLAVVDMSGAYGAYHPLATIPPPPMRSNNAAGVAAAQTPAGSSGTHAPLGNPLVLSSSGESGAGAYREAPPPRSKVLIGIGVLAAAVLGGLLGMAAFRVTASHGGVADVAASPALTVPTPAMSVPSPMTTTSASASPSAAEAAAVTLHVTSDPPGANVREDAAELCASTPCEITFKGEAADPTRVHRLLFTHLGFRPELKQVKSGDPPLTVRLFRGGGGGRPVTPVGSSKPEATPNGFKDLPY